MPPEPRHAGAAAVTRAERAESDLDTARTENHRLAEQLAQAANAEADPEPVDAPTQRAPPHSEPH